MGEPALRIEMTETVEGPAEVVSTKPQTDSTREVPSMHMTEEEYLAFDRASDWKHEYIDGKVIAMSGGTAFHGGVAAGFIGEFRNALEGRKCRVYTPDVRVYSPEKRSYVYPDASVVCGRPEYRDATKDTILNPKVIVEVLSPSSEEYDRVKKFALYRSIPSLMHYVIAAQDKPLLEVHTRQEDGSWDCRVYGPGDKVAFAALDCKLDMDLVYRDVFDEDVERAAG
jgi:Uma2 family endonuclease